MHTDVGADTVWLSAGTISFRRSANLLKDLDAISSVTSMSMSSPGRRTVSVPK